MSRIEDVLKMENVAEGAKEELRDAKKAVQDLKALANLSQSEGGERLLDMLQEDCRDILLRLLKAKEAHKTDEIMVLLSDFEAKFTLYNTIKSASRDYSEADEALSERLDEILEG